MVYGSDQAQDVDAIYLKDGMTSACGMKDATNNGFCTNGLRLARSQGSILLDVIFLIGQKVYWAHGADISSQSTVAGSNDAAVPGMKIASTYNFDPVSALWIQGTTVFFAENGTIEKAPLAPDSMTTVIARGQMTPSSMVGNADNLFWATSDCAINTMAVPK